MNPPIRMPDSTLDLPDRPPHCRASFYIEARILEAVYAAAHQRNLSRSDMVEAILKAWLRQEKAR